MRKGEKKKGGKRAKRKTREHQAYSEISLELDENKFSSRSVSALPFKSLLYEREVKGKGSYGSGRWRFTRLERVDIWGRPAGRPAQTYSCSSKVRPWNASVSTAPMRLCDKVLCISTLVTGKKKAKILEQDVCVFAPMAKSFAVQHTGS